MDRVARVEIFLEVVRQRGFVGAGKVLGLSGSAVSKQVQNLEDALGVKLLHRTTRQVVLTEEGELYFQRASRALEELKEAEAQLLDRKNTPSGLLKVNMPLSFGMQYLRAPLAGFAKAYPEVVLDVSFDDRMVDVVGEGFDVVVRIGALADSTLIVKKLAECPVVLCASPAYLKAHGKPKMPDELAQHRMIAFTRHGSGTEWRWRDTQGRVGLSAFPAAFKANTSEMMREAALEGVGIAVLPIFSVATYLKAGGLVRVLQDYETYPVREIVMLYPPGGYISGRVQLFLDWMRHACKALPW